MAVRSGVVCDGRLADRQQLSGIDLHDANIKDGAAIIVIELQLGTRPLHTIIHRVVIRRRNRRIKLIILEYEIRSVAVQLICRFSAFPFGIRQFRAAGHDVKANLLIRTGGSFRRAGVQINGIAGIRLYAEIQRPAAIIERQNFVVLICADRHIVLRIVPEILIILQWWFVAGARIGSF